MECLFASLDDRTDNFSSRTQKLLFSPIKLPTKFNFINFNLEMLRQFILRLMVISNCMIMALECVEEAKIGTENNGNGNGDDFMLKMKESKIPETNVNGPFKDDFVKWIESNGYSKYDFCSFVLGPQASYGGKESPNQSINKRPIVFIHGNSDGALAEGADEWAQGWSATIEHLHRRGYSAAELYAITYGDRNLNNSLTRSMNCSILLRLRHFVEAVLLYTGAEKIDIIAHSMGVTLARKVIQGTMALGEGGDGSCHLGTSIRHRVHTFIGIAGANYGLCLCAESAPEFVRNSPACNRETGFWAAQSECPRHPDQEEEEQNQCAGATPALQTAQCNGPRQYAAVLQTLNTPNKGKDAHFVVSMWSRGDALLGPSNLVWGHHTSLIPHSDNSTVYASHSHHSIKWMTLEDQAAFVGAQNEAN